MALIMLAIETELTVKSGIEEIRTQPLGVNSRRHEVWCAAADPEITKQIVDSPGADNISIAEW